MPLELSQIVASLVALAVAAAMVAVVALGPRRWRRAATLGLCACALLALTSGARFGALHTISMDANADDVGPGRAKIARHLPLQLHEIFHYDLGAKYFAELGYLGLYDCVTLGDAELAARQAVPPRITGRVRRLDDVLTDETREEAAAECAAHVRPRFSAARWAAFETDLRALERFLDDGAWNALVDDAGFNPPPSTVPLYSAVASVVPLGSVPVPSILVATSLDALLLAAAFVAMRRAFGAATAAVAVVAFGTSFFANYGWLGGALLRMLWPVAITLGLCALRRGRWALAGGLLALATCDRVFPAAFLAGAAIPLVARAVARGDRGATRALARFAAGSAAVVCGLGLLSLVAYGPAAWITFAERTLRYDDIYYEAHLGLRKLLVYRHGVEAPGYGSDDSLAAFRAWNLRLRATWASERPLGIAIQLAGIAAAAWVAARRKPYEAAMLVGVVTTFLVALPTTYNYVELALVPAMIFHGAATSPERSRRRRELAALGAFGGLWVLSLVVPRWVENPVFCNLVLCGALAAFLAAWTAAWARGRAPLRVPERA